MQTGTRENRKAARVSDLSPGGVFIATTWSIATGTNIEMLFEHTARIGSHC
jgi:hypothetical protein